MPLEGAIFPGDKDGPIRMNDDSRRVSATRYATIAILLHWVIAAAIILQLVLASRMEAHTPTAFAVTQLHKSVGITVLALSLVRLWWRLTNPPPPEPAGLAPWERMLSQGVHWGFYGIMIGMPLTGWLMVSASKTAIPTLLYGVVHWPNIPGVGDLAPAAKAVWHKVGETGHGLLGKLVYLLLALHVAGALKHQLFSKDEPILGRMAPGAVGGRWLEPRLFVIAGAAAAVIGFGLWVTPPRSKSPPPPLPAAAFPPEPETPAATPIGPAAVAPPTPASADAPAPLAVWKVRPGSSLTFSTSWGGEPINGRFDRWQADILFSPDVLDKSRVTVKIDLGSVKTGDEQRDASLPAADWFDTASHPTATFTANRFEKTGDGRYVAHGALTLRGVEKPLDLRFRLKITDGAARVSGTASLDRLAFGVGQGEWQATDSVPAKVAVGIDLQARRVDP
jgi:cytochrome b561/polyisoprenoid-binding protein YceI